MANLTTSNPIGAGGLTADQSLGLEKYRNEVIVAFDDVNIALKTVTVKSIEGALSEQFIIAGKGDEADAIEHTEGTFVNSTIMDNNKRVITIGKKVVYSTSLDILNQKIAQWDARSEYVRQGSQTLARKMDKKIFADIENFISTDAGVADQDAGAVITVDLSGAATTEAKGDALAEALFEAQVIMEEKNVPMMDVVCVTTPRNYSYLVQGKKTINVDYRGNGSYAKGNVVEVAGLPILKSNHLPTTATNTFNLHAMVYTPDVLGVLTAFNIESEMNYDYNRLAWKLTSYYAIGTGGLNPACGVVITEEAIIV